MGSGCDSHKGFLNSYEYIYPIASIGYILTNIKDIFILMKIKDILTLEAYLIFEFHSHKQLGQLRSRVRFSRNNILASHKYIIK